MPTETVYGVAADALNPKAVLATFAAKGRPADNPLIVHLADFSEADRIAEVSTVAERLAVCFCPGPLTLVLPKRPSVPDVTTGGHPTVAIRVPAHPVARALVRAAATPLSAPSANLFMGVSPTRASDIDPRLAAHLAVILDGGACEVGLESTVLDLSEAPARVLRPGAITPEALAEVLGYLPAMGGGERRSPGMYPRHYAPKAPVFLVSSLGPEDTGIAIGVPAASTPKLIFLPDDPAAFGAGLYAALNALDRARVSAILVETPPETSAWAAVWDRLRRATTT
jgi:L-threonylcarbamoyladenylate synthase